MTPRFVYFARCIADSGLDMQTIKVGCAYVPDFRVNSVCAQLPFRCELVAMVPGDLIIERAVQLWLRKEKIRGEYFHYRGETISLLDTIRATGKLPFAIIEDPSAHRMKGINIPEYMHRMGITAADVADVADTSPKYYEKLIERKPDGNRWFLAALMVAALRKGITINWPHDFTFTPEPQEVAA